MITLPYNPMNQEMKRITPMGRKIVSIKNVDETPPAETSESSGE